MRTPVLIAARNEAETIGRALSALPRSCEPIVIANGCEDDTAAIATRYGAETIIRDEPGKMPALQDAMHRLGNRALDPFVTLDGDSYPIMPSRWLQTMLAGRNHLDPKAPAVVVGSLIFNELPVIQASVKTAGYITKQWINRTPDSNGVYPGANMLIHPKTDAALEELMSLGNIWPGEDKAIKDVISSNQGSARKIFSPASIVVTSGARYRVMWRDLLDPESYYKQILQSYFDEQPLEPTRLTVVQ